MQALYNVARKAYLARAKETKHLCLYVCVSIFFFFKVTVRGELLRMEGLYNVGTKAYLALGRDGYSVFAKAKV